MKISIFMSRTQVLIRKNFIIIIQRKWLSTVIRSLVLPILLLVLLLEIQNFSKDPSRHGIGAPHPLRNLESSLKGAKPIVLSRSPDLGPDFPPVLERFKKYLGDHEVIELVGVDEINSRCPVDYHGHTPCHAALLFKDSPESGNEEAKWVYEIRTDPALSSFASDDFSTSTAESIILPLQSAIENAIANLTEEPDVQAFTSLTQEEADTYARQAFQYLALYLLSFVFFFTMVPMAHHLAGMIAYERASGISQLIDAMAGNEAVWSRVASYVITFDILYLPLWIILGAVFWHLLLPGQNLAVVIFWQIFTGWSITSASVFGAAFFKNYAFGSLFVSLIPVLLAVVGAFTENLIDPPSLAQIVVLSLLFPSMNYVYFLDVMLKAEILGERLNLGTAITQQVSYSLRGRYWGSLTGSYFLWVILVAQIIIFPLLAVLVEKALHGNNRQRREFDTGPESVTSQVAIKTSGLSKHYKPSRLRKICCCARTPKTKAVDGLDLESYRNQVLCLLGPNGSGKTTTLDMLAGFQKPTDGSITINAPSSQIGVCPQKNVLWDNLTVSEHLTIWAALKGGGETSESLEQLTNHCDLKKKKDNLAASLSGGTKRKLQLACMLVGGSTVCFADEITSGLDPLSRRIIWEVIKHERARRTIVLTTHFLDEAEVLSDHIVIITLGKMKCQGTPAKLKNEHGGGYRVHIPKTEDISGLAEHHSIIEQHDRYICKTSDSSSAARLLSSIKTSASTQLYITGPTIEDVFLKVAEEPHTLIGESPEDFSTANSSLSGDIMMKQSNPSVASIYIGQIRALFLKRVYLLRSTWWQYIFALAIPIVVSYFIKDFIKGYKVPQCTELIAYGDYSYPLQVYSASSLALGPESVNSSVTAIITEVNGGEYYGGYSDYGPYVLDSRQKLVDFVYSHSSNLTSSGAIWAGNGSKPLIAYDAGYGVSASNILNLLNQVRSGLAIEGSLAEFTRYTRPDGGNSIFWVTVFCLVQALYPAFFSLYPTYERRSQVRALQYSNGIRPFPLIFSYWMFDAIFVLIVSAACTGIISGQAEWFGIGYLFLVQVLYGLAAALFSYLVSFIARSQPAAFAFATLFMALMYVLSIITLLVLNINQGNSQIALDGTAYGLGIIFPIQNLLRSAAVGLNTYIVRCRGQTIVTYAGSIYAHGGPILLLILQNIWLFLLLLWLEGGRIPIFSEKKAIASQDKNGDLEKTILSGRPDVDAETKHVMSSETDLLRMKHVSKNYGSFRAVDDVTLGLREGEILALLGPNGAGKTTAINMIRGDVAPSSGNIFLQDIDVHKNTRLAQRGIGVCPQFDALDLLTVQQQLAFYARCKGVADVRAEATRVMGRVGLMAHAEKLATKLSGGNKRKLSLGITLVGGPRVLVLDEPSSAMDAASKRVLWATLQRAVAVGQQPDKHYSPNVGSCSVLLTTHSMEEADALATRAAILSAGRLLAVGSAEGLRKTHCDEYLVHLVLRSAPLSTPEEMRRVADWASARFGGPGVVVFEGENLGGQVRFVVPTDADVPQPHAQGGPDITNNERRSFTRYLIETLEAHREDLGLDCYTISAATMESVFLRVVKKSTDGDEEDDDETRAARGEEREKNKKKSWWLRR